MSGEPRRLSDGENIALALARVFESPNETDSNGECANVVDGLFAIARALDAVSRSVDAVAHFIRESNE